MFVQQVLTWAMIFETYVLQVSDQWWFAPGHGDWSTCLERYTLCSDGMYHKVRHHILFACGVAREVALGSCCDESSWCILGAFGVVTWSSWPFQQDQFERALPTFIQLLELNEHEQEDYKEVMGMVKEGREVSQGDDFDFQDEYERPLMNQLPSGVSTTRINNKVRRSSSRNAETFPSLTRL